MEKRRSEANKSQDYLNKTNQWNYQNNKNLIILKALL